MRQTLLRIVLDELWAFRVTANDPQFLGWGSGLYLGVGWLLVPWAIAFLVWFWKSRKITDHRGTVTVQKPPLMFGLIPAGIVLVRFMATDGASVPIFGYGFMLLLAFVVGGWDASRRARREGIPGELLWDLGMWMFFAGIVGCRVFHLIQYWDRNFGDKETLSEMLWQAVNLSNGGMVLYGGVIAGLITYLVFCRLRNLNPWQMADVIIPGCFLGIMLGRLGCLLNGCCFGDQCGLPWAIRFPEDSVPYVEMIGRGVILPGSGTELWLHPSQIYSAINALLLYALTASFFPVRPRHGAVLGLALLGYPITRFLIEFLRADELGQFSTSFTISQWVSLGMFTVGVGFNIWQMTRPQSNAST